MELSITIKGIEKIITVEKKKDSYMFLLDGEKYEVKTGIVEANMVSFIMNNRSFEAVLSKNESGRHLAIGGLDYMIETVTDDGAAGSSRGDGHGNGSVESPMPGSIVAVNISKGDKVEAGDAVIVIESMKMQNEIAAPVGGTVKSVKCSVGDQVAFGDLLVEIENDTSK